MLLSFFVFFFLIWRSLNFLVKVESIIWLSSSRKDHFFILSSITRDSTKLTPSSWISSSSSVSSSSEIYYVSSLALLWVVIALTQSSRNLSHQSTLCSLIIGLDVGISASKQLYTAADISGLNSCTSTSSSESYSSTSIKSSLLWTTPHFSKQLFIVVLVTSFHVSCAHWMAIRMFTSLMIPIAEEFPLILASTYLTSYNGLRHERVKPFQYS